VFRFLLWAILAALKPKALLVAENRRRLLRRARGIRVHLLLDRIGRAGEERWGNREVEGSPRFEVDGEIVVRAASISTTAASVVGS